VAGPALSAHSPANVASDSRESRMVLFSVECPSAGSWPHRQADLI
jgi:hypothetical protein